MEYDDDLNIAPESEDDVSAGESDMQIEATIEGV